jgi:hypothetical protein
VEVGKSPFGRFQFSTHIVPCDQGMAQWAALPASRVQPSAVRGCLWASSTLPTLWALLHYPHGKPYFGVKERKRPITHRGVLASGFGLSDPSSWSTYFYVSIVFLFQLPGALFQGMAASWTHKQPQAGGV